ncbi:MAG: hypothetical protein R6U46_12755 [Marinilabilia sp.]
MPSSAFEIIEKKVPDNTNNSNARFNISPEKLSKFNDTKLQNKGLNAEGFKKNLRKIRSWYFRRRGIRKKGLVAESSKLKAGRKRTQQGLSQLVPAIREYVLPEKKRLSEKSFKNACILLICK